MKKHHKAHSDLNLGTLEEDFLSQTRRMQRATDKQAEAKKDLAEAEAEFKAVAAELKNKIRSHPKKYGADKATEGAINELVILQPEYQEAQQQVIEAQYLVDLLGGEIRTLDDRRRTIEGLIQLHGQGYFAKPKVKDNNSFRDAADDADQDRVFRKRKKPLYR